MSRGLQQEFNLPRDNGGAPLVAFVGRLVEQKGIDLIVSVIQEWVQSSGVQWVVLGTGDPKYHEQLQTLAQRHPQKVAVRFEFSERLAHQIEAGADMFLNAQPVRAVWAEPALQPEIRHGADCPRHRRPGRYRHEHDR